jgi:hypothetical protein
MERTERNHIRDLVGNISVRLFAETMDTCQMAEHTILGFNTNSNNFPDRIIVLDDGVQEVGVSVFGHDVVPWFYCITKVQL